jgi:gliding motility-associated-like protein
VCAPGTVDLTATSVTTGSTLSTTFTYFMNAAATTTLATPAAVGTSGTYYIKGTSAESCSVVKSVTTTINAIPIFNLTSPSVCIGNSVIITAILQSGLTSDYTFTWTVPTGVAAPGTVSSFSSTVPGTYAAKIKNKNTGCESGLSNTSVSFYPLPVPAAIVASANKVGINKELNLTAAASGGTSPYSYTWLSNPAKYLITGQENAVLKALNEGKVNINYKVQDANNCSANSANFEITIESEGVVLVLPNAFTPNGDDKNDIFKVASSNSLGKASFRYFEIYDRNGRMMYSTNNISNGWDGRYKGIVQDMGVYFVKLVKVNESGQQVAITTPFYLLK